MKNKLERKKIGYNKMRKRIKHVYPDWKEGDPIPKHAHKYKRTGRPCSCEICKKKRSRDERAKEKQKLRNDLEL